MYRLILYPLICILISCNDHLKIEANDQPQRVADSQMAGSWRIVDVSSDVAYDWNNDGSPERDIYATWTSCQKDHLYTFSGEVVTGTEKKGIFKINCTTTRNGVWQIVFSETASYLVYTPESLPPEAEKFISMTSVQFKSTIDVTLPNGQPATITKTWIRQ